MSITVNQIAQISGVSRTTVIRALNGQGRVSAETKKRVLAVAHENGYRPNLLARSLNKGRTMSIGVIADSVKNYVFAESLDAINQEARERGYFLNIALQGRNPKIEYKCIQEMADRQVEGLLISAVNQGPEFEAFLAGLNIPIVCLGNWVSDAFSTVLVDEKQAAQDAVRLMVQHGYQRIVFVCPPLEDEKKLNIYTHKQRLAGIREAQRCLPQVEVEVIGKGNFLPDLAQIVAASNCPTAVFCSGDVYALTVLQWARESGIGIPGDIGLMGFDDICVLDYITPHLTTISTNVTGIAQAAVTHLIAKIEDSSLATQRIYLNYKVIERETLRADCSKLF